MVAQPTCSPARQCWLRAWERAVNEKLIPYLNADGSWTVKSYTITVTGASWSHLACSCPGGRHIACKHRSVVAAAISRGLRPVRGTERTAAAPAPFVPVASTFMPQANDPLAAVFA